MLNHFDPNKSLLTLPIVIWTFGITLFFSLFVMVCIIFTSNLVFDFTSDGFNRFINYFKVPIGIVSLNIPLIALFGANHRSEQTKAQLTLSKSQNNFANHFKHLEEFEKYCSNALERQKTQRKEDVENEKAAKERGRFVNSRFLELITELPLSTHVHPDFRRRLYAIIYTESKKGNFNTSPQYIESIDKFINDIINISQIFKSTPSEEFAAALTQIRQKTKIFAASNFISFSGFYGESEIQILDKKIPLSSDCISGFLRDVFSLVSEINYLLEFDISYEPSALIKSVNEFNFIDDKVFPKNNLDDLKNFVPFDLNAYLTR